MRGHPGKNLKGEVKDWAERMGCHWVENMDPSVPFDGFLYRNAIMVALKAKKVRYGLEADCIIEDKFPDDVLDLRSLPLPQYILRELWVRTQNERAYRRFYILPETTMEIEINTAEHYKNTHFREEYWKMAPYRIDIPLDTGGLGRDEVK